MNIVVELIAKKDRKGYCWPFIVQVSYNFGRIETNSASYNNNDDELKLNLIQNLNSNTKRTRKKPMDGTVQNWA